MALSALNYCFQELVNVLKPHIGKKSTLMRKPLSVEEKLAVTLRFLATGESYESLQYQFRIHRTTIALFIPFVCRKIYECLKEEYLKLPSTKDEWKDIANSTQKRWQFPNCIGAADGKHISTIHPCGSGSEFFNYKGFYNIVLLALIDHDYKFIYVDVGCQGCISDGGIYRHSSFYNAVMSGILNLPDPEPLPKSPDPVWQFDQPDVPIPFFFVADEAFPLSINCMKPYLQKNLPDRKIIFNYRLSRMLRISENVFGIWSNRFCVFTTSIALAPDKAKDITMATIVLHNMLRTKGQGSFTPEGSMDQEVSSGGVELGDWREDNVSLTNALSKIKSNRASDSAENIRNTLVDHFYGPGQIPWQWKILF